MFSILVSAVIILMFVYYIDIVIKIYKDEKAKKVRYKGFKLIIPFAYWIDPYKEKKPVAKKKSNVKSKTKKK